MRTGLARAAVVDALTLGITATAPMACAVPAARTVDAGR